MRFPRVRWWSGFVVLVACGGNSFSRDGSGTGGDGGTGAAAASGASGIGTGGSSSGTAGASGTPGCEPMDARSNGDECASIPGFAWDGSMCHPIVCGCAGSDCVAIYPTIDACDQARADCYASRGVRRDCMQHADCGLVPRACCEPCGRPSAEAYLGVHIGSPMAGICGPIGCPDCVSLRDPAIYPLCLDGQCTVGDLGAAAAVCTFPDECRVRTKDCCECNSDTTPPALMAVGPGFNGVPPWCSSNMGCPRCAATPVPPDVHATCDGASGHCRILLPPRSP